MDVEKLEIINLLTKYDKDDITKIMIVMTYWQEMVEKNIVDKNDINDLANLSKEKQKKIKEFVSNKISSKIERNKNGNKKSKKEKL